MHRTERIEKQKKLYPVIAPVGNTQQRFCNFVLATPLEFNNTKRECPQVKESHKFHKQCLVQLYITYLCAQNGLL